MRCTMLLGDEPVSVCGDGQMDSPGFSAKTCVYSLMHTSLEYMLHVEVVDARHAQMKRTEAESSGSGYRCLFTDN